MIWFSFKFFISFLISFLLMSIQLGQKPVFYHMNQLLGPLSADIQQSVKKNIKHVAKEGAKMGKDMIKDAASKTFKSSKAQNLDNVTKDEKKQLDHIINQ